MDERTRLLHVLRAWYWTGAGVFDPARADPLYPRDATSNANRAQLWAAVDNLLDDQPYVRSSVSAGDGQT